ncbi:MAG TPA: YbhN family protein [Acidimicrobiales bacterium]|nr:YbhN family protein [Acidimicrobiales bacterium]
MGKTVVVRRWVTRLVGIGVAAVVVSLLVVPQAREGLREVGVLGRVFAGYVVLAVALEVASFLAYGFFTRAVLPAAGRPRWHWLLRVDLFGAGLTHILPGGGAAASAVRFRMLRRGGVDGTAAAFGSALQGVGSALVLVGLLLGSVVWVLPSVAHNPLYATAAGVAGGLVAVAAVGALVLTRGRRRAASIVEWAGARLHLGRGGGALVHRVADRAAEFRRDPRMLLSATGWAAANWLFDAASLWVFLAAFGHRVPLAPILVAFALANLIAVLPVTPGGLGIIEGVLIPSLIGFGTPRAVAVVGVLAWRLVNFWAPIPAGGLAWLSLRMPRRPSAAAG